MNTERTTWELLLLVGLCAALVSIAPWLVAKLAAFVLCWWALLEMLIAQEAGS